MYTELFTDYCVSKLTIIRSRLCIIALRSRFEMNVCTNLAIGCRILLKSCANRCITYRAPRPIAASTRILIENLMD